MSFPPGGRVPALLRVLGRHPRRQHRRKGETVAGVWRRIEGPGRGIAACGLDNGLGQDVVARSIDDAAFAGTEIGGATALLRMTGRNLIGGMFGLPGELLAV